MHKLLRISALPLLASVIFGCSNIPIRNIPVYWNLPNGGAVIAYTLSDETVLMNKADWDVKRVGYASLSDEDYRWLIATIEKACASSKIACKKEDQLKMARVVGRLERGRRRRD